MKRKNIILISFLNIICFISCNFSANNQTKNTAIKEDSIAGIKKDSVAWGKESNGLQLGIFIKADSIYFYYKNCSDKEICICSHTCYGLTWNHLEMKDKNDSIYNFNFDDIVKTMPCAPITVCIKAGDKYIIGENLSKCISYQNGYPSNKYKIKKGAYQVTGYYELKKDTHDTTDENIKHWKGKIMSSSLKYKFY